jgi:hypothetical protein
MSSFRTLAPDDEVHRSSLLNRFVVWFAPKTTHIKLTSLFQELLNHQRLFEVRPVSVPPFVSHHKSLQEDRAVDPEADDDLDAMERASHEGG